jgi:hypothetical protein
MNSNEPFGLPNGTVRGVIALAITAVSLYLFATAQAVPEALLAVNGLVIGNYFGARGQDNAIQSAIAGAVAAPEVVAAPYIPSDSKPL